MFCCFFFWTFYFLQNRKRTRRKICYNDRVVVLLSTWKMKFCSLFFSLSLAFCFLFTFENYFHTSTTKFKLSNKRFEIHLFTNCSLLFKETLDPRKKRVLMHDLVQVQSAFAIEQMDSDIFFAGKSPVTRARLSVFYCHSWQILCVFELFITCYITVLFLKGKIKYLKVFFSCWLYVVF